MQCSAWKPWVLTFTWMPLDTHYPPKRRYTPHDSGTPTWLCPTSRRIRPATLQKLLRKERSRHQLGLWIPQIPNQTQNLWNMLEQLQSMKNSLWIRLGSDLSRREQRSPGSVSWSLPPRHWQSILWGLCASRWRQWIRLGPIHPVDARSNWDLGNLVDPSAFFPAPGAILKK